MVATDYHVLQLSTHAFLNDSFPMMSYFLLAKPQSMGEDGFVHTYEILNTKLKADLVMLTACETGLGRIQTGEGVLSLANAFHYAGCSGILMSLWGIDEEASNELLRAFYDDLANDLNRRDALHHAKTFFVREQRKRQGESFIQVWTCIIGELSKD